MERAPYPPISDEWHSEGLQHCRRCELVRWWYLLTLKGVGREVKRSYVPSVADSLYAKNPLLKHLGR